MLRDLPNQGRDGFDPIESVGMDTQHGFAPVAQRGVMPKGRAHACRPEAGSRAPQAPAEGRPEAEGRRPFTRLRTAVRSESPSAHTQRVRALTVVPRAAPTRATHVGHDVLICGTNASVNDVLS